MERCIVCASALQTTQKSEVGRVALYFCIRSKVTHLFIPCGAMASHSYSIHVAFPKADTHGEAEPPRNVCPENG